jgi:crotonobetainyl-CoA:carnitine CoA-transferase CaiB-like acyl-CoA transferase
MATGIYCLGWDLGIQSVLGKVAPASPRDDNPTPLVNSYRAGDDRWFFLIGLEGDRHFPGVARAIGRPDLIEDERFNTARGRLKNRAELIGIFDSVFATRTRTEWAARFDAEDVWWQPVQQPAEVVADEQAAAIGAFVDVEQADGSPPFRAAASPIHFHGDPLTVARPVPDLGEHTDEVLRDLD